MAGNENEELFETLAAQAAPERIGEAAPRLRTAERRQVEWRPVSLEELVRTIIACVRSGGLSKALTCPRCSAQSNPSRAAWPPGGGSAHLAGSLLFATIEPW